MTKQIASYASSKYLYVFYKATYRIAGIYTICSSNGPVSGAKCNARERSPKTKGCLIGPLSTPLSSPTVCLCGEESSFAGKAIGREVVEIFPFPEPFALVPPKGLSRDLAGVCHNHLAVFQTYLKYSRRVRAETRQGPF